VSKRRARQLLYIIVLLYLGLGVAYSVVNPIFESPDEALNYDNIRYLIEERRLPVLEPDEPTKAHHPPLYYVLGALLTFWVPNEHLDAIVERTNPFWAYRLWEPGVDNKSLYLHDPTLESFPYRDVALGVHLIRWLSLLMGAGTILLVYATAREIITAVYGGRNDSARALAVGAAALVAFNPMFLYISGSVHDDPLANLVSAAMLYVATRILVHGATVRRAATLGLLMGLGVLTKLTCLLVMPTAGLALLYRPLADRGRAGWRDVVRLGGVALGLALLIGGWWFARNWVLYGEPTAMVRQTGVWGVRENAPDFVAAARELGFLHNSLWGIFGYGQIPFPRPIYDLARLMGLMALGGLLLLYVRHRLGRTAWRGSLSALGVLATAPIIALAVNFARMTISAAADFGRYLFVTLAILAPLYALGLAEWLSVRRRTALAPAIALGMLTLAVYGLVGVLAPAYAPPPRYASPDAVSPQYPADVTYPGLARLIGYDTAPDPPYPGDTLRVTFYWEVLDRPDEDYVFFVQVFGRGGVKLGGRDTHPGLGRYPTSRWQPGEVIADTVPVPLPEDAAAPTALRLDLGFYLLDGPRLPTADGLTTVSLGPVRLAAREPMSPVGAPLDYRLGEGIRLVAWEPAWEGPIHPGDTLRFTLYWACDAPPGRPFNVFVHLIGEEGPPVAQGDGPPMEGDYPTHLWTTGDVIADPRTVHIPPDLPSGRYRLLVGLYSLETGERLPAFDAGGTRLLNDTIPLSDVEIRP
jgi:hypothetical protein